MLTSTGFHYVSESAEFFSLFPHRHDYIWAKHRTGTSVEWQTESRHPLSDRLIDQGAYLYGVRFAKETRYCLIDIDRQSQYHPTSDSQAIARIIDALEPLGLVSALCCTSSYSGGLHLYFPFEQPQKTWQLAIALQSLLENAGFQIALGQLELFPNAKAYVEGQPSLYAAHRLPLQVGSYLLNEDFQPIYSSRAAFLERWRFAQHRNAINIELVEQVLKTARRQRYYLSGKADKYLNDLNAEIELGWSGPGQTNRLLGRIAMRSYVFGHVLYAPQPIEGRALVADIVRVATSLPGYEQWCRHQHEIEKRAEEWAKSVESSHYFHYRRRRIVKVAETPSWNQQQQQAARVRITAAIQDLLHQNKLPATVTARFHALTVYGIGGSSLYRHRDLWHPIHLQLAEYPPDPPASDDCCGWESIGDAPQPQYSPSLLEAVGSNSPPGGDLRAIAPGQNESLGRNSLNDLCDGDRPTTSDLQSAASETSKNTPRWIQTLLFELKNVRIASQSASEPVPKSILADRAIAQRQEYLERMQSYLESDDPILVGEALQALRPAG